MTNPMEKIDHKKILSITPKQFLWLNQQGGRNANDVRMENGKLGIYMIDDRAFEKFYPLPEDKKLKLIQRKEGNKEYQYIRYIVKEK